MTPLPPSEREILKQRNRELSILNTIAESLNRSVDLDETLRVTLAQVVELFDLQTGWVWLLREDTGESYLAAAQNLPPALTKKPERMEGTCYCLDTYEAGDLDGAANVNVITCSRLKWLSEGTGGLRYHASIPLYAHGKKLGVLNLASGDWRELSAEDLRLIYTIGDLLGIAIERARLFQQSTRLGVLDERNRLAREIHDTLAQGLAGIALQLETADALVETQANPEKIQQFIQHALKMTRASLDEARRSVLDLRAAPLENRTLAEALRALANSSQAKWNIKVVFSAVGEYRPLPVQVETGLYRVAQEALTNAQKHANAQKIILRLVTTPEQVQLTISDNGQGFDPDKLAQGHFGLVGLNERVKLLNGHFHLQSSPGEGTLVEVLIPLT
jgi:two-component system, NarL family, sensor kinase